MLRAELGAAFMLLSRLPAGRLTSAPHADPARCVWAYPLVGAVVGGIGAGAYWLCAWMGLPPSMAAIWTVAVLVLVTGGLHEDGLADTADGFGGGSSAARKLEIMRDSRIGSYGALALLLSTALRWAALAELAAPGRVGPALIAAGALSRGALAIPLLALPPARGDGLAASLLHAALHRVLLAPVVAALIALAFLPLWSAVLAAALSGVAAIAATVLARQQIGGYTGDVLGACVVVVECLVLSQLAAS